MEETAGKTVKRRGILAAAGAVVAGIVAKHAEHNVAAAPTTMMTETNNIVTATTTLSAEGAVTTNTFADGVLLVDAHLNLSNATGLTVYGGSGNGLGGGTAIIANAGPSQHGVVAHGGLDSQSTKENGSGVVATAGGIQNPAGETLNRGVYGEAGPGHRNNGDFYKPVAGVGVHGVGTGDFTTGVRGEATGTMVGSATGVIGVASGPNAVGVSGSASDGLYGVVGVSGSQAGAAGLLGYSATANGVAFGSVVTAPATLAGYFNGIVHVTGPFIVDDLANKHGAIDHANGTTRLLYSMESPESWIEDFGTGTLAGGTAEITLDPGFAGIVHTDDYHVFLTAHDTDHHLAVTSRAGAGFAVESVPSSDAAAKGKKAAYLAGTFSYRVVAQPQVRRTVERLPKYTRPAFDVAAVERMAKVAATPPAKPAGKP